MNKENMLKVADFIEKENANDFRFDMASWIKVPVPRDSDKYMKVFSKTGSLCGTSACIGGTANLLEMKEKRLRRFSDASAQEWLGLNDRQEVNLFYCEQLETTLGDGVDAFEYVNERRELVPDALRWMAHTGIVDWKKGFTAARKAAACRRTAKAA